MNDLVDSLMSMKLDVYVQQDEQDINTGAIKKSWHYRRTVDCHAKATISNSSTSRTSDKQTIGNKYANEQIIQIRTLGKITYREKITNIRDSQGNVIWSELNFPSDTPTVFEIISPTPVTDPFGGILAYNSVAKRSENQQIGI